MVIEVSVYIFVSFEYMLFEHSGRQFTWKINNLFTASCSAQIKWQALFDAQF